MALPFETTSSALQPERFDAWIFPMTAAIVVGGSILFWCLAGLFWLAIHPPQQPIVIHLTPPAIRAAESNRGFARPPAEEPTDVRSN